MFDVLLYKTEVSRFLASMPRHRLIIVKDCNQIPGETLNLGYDLASWIKAHGKRDSRFTFDLQYEVNNEVSGATFSVSGIGTVIPVCNIGILFEPVLEFPPEAFLKKFSKNDILILFWPGAIKGNRLYLPDTNSDCKIDLTEINHLVI